MKKVHIIDFIDFLKRANALDKYINAVREQEAAGLLDFGFRNMPAWSWLNSITWSETDEGQNYWQDLEQKWYEEIGFSWEEELEKLERSRKFALEKLAEE